MKCLIIFLALASSTSALVLPCTAERGAFPKSVTIEDCDENEKRCAFTRGKNLKVDVEFTAGKFSREPKPGILVNFLSQFPISRR